MEKNYLTPAAASRELHIHTETLRRYSVEGKIPFERTAGGHRRYRQEDIETFKRQLELGELFSAVERQGESTLIKDALKLSFVAVEDQTPEIEVPIKDTRKEASEVLLRKLNLKVDPDDFIKSERLPVSSSEFWKDFLRLETFLDPQKELNKQTIVYNFEIPFGSEEAGILQVSDGRVNYHQDRVDAIYDIESLEEIGVFLKNSYAEQKQSYPRNLRTLKRHLSVFPFFALTAILSYIWTASLWQAGVDTQHFNNETEFAVASTLLVFSSLFALFSGLSIVWYLRRYFYDKKTIACLSFIETFDQR